MSILHTLLRIYKSMHGSPLVFLLAGHLAVVCLGQLPGYLLGNGVLAFLGNSGGWREKGQCEMMDISWHVRININYLLMQAIMPPEFIFSGSLFTRQMVLLSRLLFFFQSFPDKFIMCQSHFKNVCDSNISAPLIVLTHMYRKSVNPSELTHAE